MGSLDVAFAAPPDSIAALRRLRAQSPRLLADYHARRRAGDPEGAALLVALDAALVMDIPAGPYAGMLEDALELSRSAPGAVRARLLRVHGRFWTVRGGQRIALEAVAEGRRALADGGDDALATAMLTFVAVHASTELGDRGRVADEVRTLNALARAGGVHAVRLQALAHQGEGLLHIVEGRSAAALDAFGAAADAARRVGADRTLAIALANRSTVLTGLGEEERSEADARKAGALFTAVGDALHAAQIEGGRALAAPGPLDVARVLAAARASERAGDARTVAELLLALLERARGSRRQQRQWLQRAWRLLAHVDAPELERRAHVLDALDQGRPVLEVDADGRHARCADGALDLTRRKALPGVLLALVQAHLGDAGRVVGVAELFAAGWPEEKALAHAAAARVYMAIRALRAAGLREAIRSGPSGYRLDPAMEVIVRGRSGARAPQDLG